MKGIDAAIAKQQQLLSERNEPEWWSSNIGEASSLLKTTDDWTRFYAYLADGINFDRTKKYVTLNDVECLPIPDLHPSLEEVVYKNGPDTVIHIRHRSSDDEKEI